MPDEASAMVNGEPNGHASNGGSIKDKGEVKKQGTKREGSSKQRGIMKILLAETVQKRGDPKEYRDKRSRKGSKRGERPKIIL